METKMPENRVWSTRNILLLAGIAICSAWIAAGITLLNLAGRVVMSLGGFVASGGPYAIAHPAPAWIPIVPLAIVSTAFVAVFSVWVSDRAGGFGLILWLWCGLFTSLGVQFALFGFHPPAGAGVKVVWGWVICAVFFLPMGLLPLLGAAGMGNPVDVSSKSSGFRPAKEDRAYRIAYAMAVVIGAAAGIAGALLLFRSLAG
jgi:hypothetical protein